MKLKDGFKIINICGDTVAIYAGGNTVDLRRAIVLNSAAELLFHQLQTETNEKGLVQVLVNNFDISEEKAKKDVAAFVQGLSEKGLLEK